MAADQRVVVTGGASGIGAATVARFLAGGARVASLDRVSQVEPTVDRLTTMTVDLADSAAVIPAIEQAVTRLQGLDVLVCCAGIDHHGTIEQTEPEDWDRVFAVNVRAVFLSAKAAIPHLREAGGGGIVVVASQLAFVVQPNAAAYCASKAAAAHLARAISLDHGLEGIRANAVCPGPTLTPMFDAHMAAATDPAAEQASLLRKQVHGRFTTPEEIAEAVWYLASPGAASTIGTALVVDGGYSIH